MGIFAKAPIPGYAKTRLIPRLGPEGAAALQALLLKRTIRTVSRPGSSFDVTLWCAPGSDEPSLGACRIAAPVALRDQPGGDLGQRMCFAFETLMAEGGPVLLVGTDCPSLTHEHLRASRSALDDGHDAVCLPALDGGYALIGLRRLDRELFSDVPWGTSEVMTETRSRLRQLGWSWRELPAVRDIDVPDDLDWLLAGDLLDAEERAVLLRHSRGS